MFRRMGEAENRRQRQLMGQALQGHVDGEIVAAYYGMREDAWGDSWKKGPRWIRRRLASGHPADDTGSYNVLVLTPTRVMVFNAKPSPPLLKVRRKIADWPIEAVRLEDKRMTFTSHYNQQTQMSTHRVIRATLTWDGEERPLILDFPTSPNAKEVVEAVKRATIDARARV